MNKNEMRMGYQADASSLLNFLSAWTQKQLHKD